MRLLTLLLMVAGCGADPAQEQPVPAKESAPVASEAGSTNTDKPKEAGSSEAPAATSPYSLTVDAVADLPICDGSRDRQLVYVLESQQFHTCRENQWQAIDIKGKDGAVGKDGAAGEDGANGNDNHIKMIVTCTPTLPPTSVKIRYQMTEMASGDTFATADFYGSSDEVYSSTSFYAAAQPEKDTGEVRIQYDINGSYNGGYVKYLYNKVANTLTFSIHDVDYVSPLVTSWTSQSSACAKQTF